jgi:hypothetical protein
MAAISSQYVDIWIDEYELSGQNNSVDISFSTATIDTTAFQETGRTWIHDLPEATLTHNGYFNTSADAGGTQEEEIRAALTADSTIAVVLGTNQTLPVGVVLPSARARNFNISASVGSTIACNGEWGNVAARFGGMAYEGTISGTGTQSSIDLGSAGSAGGVAYVFVRSITGSATNATINIESSSDDISFASEGTATFSAVGVQTVTMSGTVNRYIQINTTSMGGATDFTVGAIVCVSGVTY